MTLILIICAAGWLMMLRQHNRTISVAEGPSCDWCRQHHQWPCWFVLSVVWLALSGEAMLFWLVWSFL